MAMPLSILIPRNRINVNVGVVKELSQPLIPTNLNIVAMVTNVVDNCGCVVMVLYLAISFNFHRFCISLYGHILQ